MCVCVCTVLLTRVDGFNVLAALATCTINEGDPYVAVVQSAYLTRHVGGAVHMLVFAFIHGVRTSVVLRI